MSKFSKGTIVYHKSMGDKGVVINEADGMIEVRTSNGHITKFHPEELETEQEFDAKNRNEITDDKNWRIGE